MNQVPFEVLRAAVRAVLERPAGFDWSVQGFGMMRTYFGHDKRYRLNLWDSALSVPDVSIIHDHPWDLRSWIVAGSLQNVRYRVGTLFGTLLSGDLYRFMVIEPGEKFDGHAFETGAVHLSPELSETYSPGGTYTQRAGEVHSSHPIDGSVTVNDRTNRGPDRARVFWRDGEWVDAKPRPATLIEVARTADRALACMDFDLTLFPPTGQLP